MRVALVTDFYYPWIAGPAALVRNLAHGLAARGHDVSILAPSPDGAPAREREGPVRIARVRTIRFPVGYGLRVAVRPGHEVRDWLDEAAPDVVHIHHPFPVCLAALRAARRRGIPIAATNHTIPECSLWGIRRLGPLYGVSAAAFGRWLVYLLGRSDAVAVPTDTAARALRSLGFRGPVDTISNGIDDARFRPGEGDGGLRMRLGLDERPVVLYTGRLDAEKQMDVWLRAAAALRRHVDIQFVVGGRGTELERLRRLARELDIEPDVRFTGYLAEEEYPELYRIADVYFVTSPVELQSICTLEAAASGLPVVAVAAGALPELVRDAENGYCVEPGDWRGAADALYRLASNPSLRDSMGRASRHVAEQHTLSSSVDRYERFLQRAAHRGEQRIGHPAPAGG